MEQISPHRIGWGLLLLRFLPGCVFLSEGIQKFLFPAALGAGRFEKIGIPAPQFMGPFVGRYRNRVRHLLNPWPLPDLRRLAFAYRYSGCDHDNQGSIAAQAGFLGSDA